MQDVNDKRRFLKSIVIYAIILAGFLFVDNLNNSKLVKADNKLSQTVDNSVINERGDTLTYKFKITLPSTETWAVSKSYQVKVYDWWWQPFPIGPWHWETQYTTVYELRDFSSSDSYTFTDNLPSDVSVTSWSFDNNIKSTNGFNNTSNKNRVSFTIGGNALQNYQGQTITLSIKAKADNLPDPKKAGWYSFDNTANYKSNTYNTNWNGSSDTDTVKIQSFAANIWHYDVDPDDNYDAKFTNDQIKNLGDNLSYNPNFNEKKGVLKKEVIYGYEDDNFNITPLQNLTTSNGNLKYYFIYGKQDAIAEQFGSSGRDYYLPYTIPKVNLNAAKLSIDTDRASNGLPFELNIIAKSKLFNSFKDYNDAQVIIKITDNSGNLLYQKQDALSNLLNNDDSTNYLTYKDELNTSPLSKQSAYGQGKKIPVNVAITFTNPNSIKQTSTGISSYGYTASQQRLTEKDFKNNVAVANGVERTVKYQDDDSVKEIWERLTLNQNRVATAKTGYGMKSDLKLQYASHIALNKYSQDGSTLDYAFPDAFKVANSNILYGSNDNKDAKTATNVDRLRKLNDSTSKIGSDDTNKMDSLSAADQAIDNKFNSNSLDAGVYTTSYQFYNRLVTIGSGADSGTVTLRYSRDPLARNDPNKTVGTSINAGYKMFTPYWMPLGTYDTVYQTQGQARDADGNAESEVRLGANWFTISNNRPVRFYAHMYLAKDSSSESQDELSIQPILSGKQVPDGFSDADKLWLNSVQ